MSECLSQVGPIVDIGSILFGPGGPTQYPPTVESSMRMRWRGSTDGTHVLKRIGRSAHWPKRIAVGEERRKDGLAAGRREMETCHGQVWVEVGRPRESFDLVTLVLEMAKVVEAASVLKLVLV